MIDIKEKKDKIISFLEMNGPSLPVRIAKAIEMDPVFASAILSELLNAKQVKISNLKVGASPLYLLQGQEQKIEEYTENLKPTENEAYQKLKDKKVLKDEDEAPAIRVALRNIKDFAIPFKFKEKIMWKYTFTPDEEIENILILKIKKREELKIKKTEETSKTEEIKEESKKIESIFVQSDKDTKKEIEKPRDASDIEGHAERPKKSRTKTFLEQIEEFLEKKNIKITSIGEVDKKKVVARIESESKTALLFAFNKAKINEQELMKCYKQAKTENLPYHLIILGDLTKKMNETMDAYKKLIKVDKLTNAT